MSKTEFTCGCSKKEWIFTLNTDEYDRSPADLPEWMKKMRMDDSQDDLPKVADEAKKSKLCDACGKIWKYKKGKKCNGCMKGMRARYCNRACQKMAWDKHKHECPREDKIRFVNSDDIEEVN